jgi:hypothetical protein
MELEVWSIAVLAISVVVRRLPCARGSFRSARSRGTLPTPCSCVRCRRAVLASFRLGGTPLAMICPVPSLVAVSVLPCADALGMAISAASPVAPNSNLEGARASTQRGGSPPILFPDATARGVQCDLAMAVLRQWWACSVRRCALGAPGS